MDTTEKEPCHRCGKMLKPLTDKARVAEIRRRQALPKDSDARGPRGTRGHKCEPTGPASEPTPEPRAKRIAEEIWNATLGKR